MSLPSRQPGSESARRTARGTATEVERGAARGNGVESAPSGTETSTLGLNLRRFALEVQRAVYPIGALVGAAVVWTLGGFVPILRRWLRDQMNLSPAAIIEAFGGAWVGAPQGDPDDDLGPQVARTDAELLWNELDEVARRGGGRVPAQVRLTYLPCCGVVACGRRERALVLGLPLLAVLNRAELRAVLVHELTHWARGDASRAARTEQFVERLSESLDRSIRRGVSWTRFSPLRGWARGNVAVAQWLRAPIARGQEWHADARAAAIAGGDVTASALMKVALVQPLFREVLNHFEANPGKDGNLYAFFRRFWALLPDGVVTAMRHRLLSEAQDRDNPAHPALLDRIAHAQTHPPRKYADGHLAADTLIGDLEAWEGVLHERLFGAARLERSVFHRAGR